MTVSPFAGKPAEPSMLANGPQPVMAYYTEVPDPSMPEQQVAFGSSGHRGSAFDKGFSERDILTVNQAFCLYREQQRIDDPLSLEMDTQLSVTVLASALEEALAPGTHGFTRHTDWSIHDELSRKSTARRSV